MSLNKVAVLATVGCGIELAYGFKTHDLGWAFIGWFFMSMLLITLGYHWRHTKKPSA